RRRSRMRSESSAAFFFSSRRRHTTFSRDWSSDVCSSDLGITDETPLVIISAAGRIWSYDDTGALTYGQSLLVEYGTRQADGSVRSEERRVGKESGGHGADEAREERLGLTRAGPGDDERRG